MSKRKDHIVKSEDYQKYLEDQMTTRERHDFEKRLLEDDFANEAFDGLSQLTPKELSADLNILEKDLNSSTKKNFTFSFFRIAAALMLLGVFSFLVYYLIETNTTKEIAQSKSIPAVEEADERKPSNAITLDSTKEEPDRIVAYQQKMEEAPVEKQITKSNIRESHAVVEEKAELAKLEILEISDNAEESEEIILDMEVTPIEIPTLAEMQNEQMEIKVERVERKKERMLEKAAAPAAAMKRRATPMQKQYDAIAENDRTITGNVSSLEDDEAIPGVNIIVKGTSVGTVSDIEGNYSIDVSNDEEVTLVYSSVGYVSEEVLVGDQKDIDVNIEPDVTALSEIVVTGYATQKRKDVTGAVSTVEMDDSEIRAIRYDPPKPVGGNGNFRDYIKENMKYPQSGLESNIKGTVKLKFTVERNGSISNMEVLKSMGKDFDQEAIRLITNGPSWEPAKENDSTVVKEVKVKIRFRPPD